MSKSSPQNLKNHGRIDPQFHYVMFFVLIANLVFAVFHLIDHWKDTRVACAWFLVLSLVVFIPFFKLRTYPLRVQDRVIRLEERLRMEKLVPEPFLSRTADLTMPQIVALRFASNAELPGLVEKTLAGNLAPKQIKESIQVWRPDYWRV